MMIGACKVRSSRGNGESFNVNGKIGATAEVKVKKSKVKNE
jgi:hypothetical protein